MNYKQRTLLTSHDRDCAKLVPAERHYCKTNQSLLLKSRNFKIKSILATRFSKHNNIRTDNNIVASWPDVSDMHAISRNYLKSGNNHFLLLPSTCIIHCISKHLALPVSELLEMSLNKPTKKWMHCYMNSISASIHHTCNAHSLSFKECWSVY